MRTKTLQFECARRAGPWLALLVWACQPPASTPDAELPEAPVVAPAVAAPPPAPRPPREVPVDPALARNAFADEPALRSARAALAAWDLPAARAAFQRFLDDHPDHPLTPKAHLVLAALHDRGGDPREAALNYGAAAVAGGPLADYARHRGARAALQAGEAALAEKLARAVDPEGRFAFDAQQLRARALLKLGRGRDARAVLVPLAKSDAADGPLRLLLAQAVETMGDLEDAARAYRDVLLRHPGTDLAEAAGKRLKALLRKLPKSARALVSAGGPVEAVAAATADLVAHRPRAVLDRVRAVLDGAQTEPGGPVWCDAAWLDARAHTKLRAHADAARAYLRFLEGCPGDRRAVSARYAGGRGAFTAHDNPQALALLAAVWTEHPEHPYADDALYTAARIQRQAGQRAHARALMTQLLRRYPDGDMAANAHWLRFHEHYAHGRLAAAVAYDVEAAERAERSRYHAGRVRYFRARALERLGRTEEAIDAFHAVLARHPLGYYGLLAANRLAALLGPAFDGALDWHVATHRVPPALPREVLAQPAFHEAIALVQVGLPGDAWWAFDAVTDDAPERAGYLRAVAEIYALAGARTLGRNVLRRELSHLEGEWPAGDGRARFELVYPLEYTKDIERFASERGLPPALVFAIAREESRFDRRARSWAGACGLMQLMVPTAQEMAEKDALRRRITCRRLYSPRLNIRLGTRYLQELDERYAHPGVVVAAYHAGHGHLGRWSRAAPFDLWVEEIPFHQTRHYIKRVLTALWAYTWLLAEPEAPMSARVPRVPLEMPDD